MSNLDLFFSIVIKDNTYRLEKLFHKNNLTLNHEKFIEKLRTYEESSLDTLNFFFKIISEFQIQGNENINNELNIKNKEKDNIDINNKGIINNNNNSNIPIANNNSQINSSKKYIYTNIFFKHPEKMKKIYEKICLIPVLDFLIQNNGELNPNYFRYENNKDSLVDHKYKDLIKLINTVILLNILTRLIIRIFI